MQPESRTPTRPRELELWRRGILRTLRRRIWRATRSCLQPALSPNVTSSSRAARQLQPRPRSRRRIVRVRSGIDCDEDGSRSSRFCGRRARDIADGHASERRQGGESAGATRSHRQELGDDGDSRRTSGWRYVAAWRRAGNHPGYAGEGDAAGNTGDGWLHGRGRIVVMVISDFAIKRPMITVVTMVALVVFGLFALWRLQTDEFPDIQQPVVLTFIPYPGASPEGVEREVLKPVEDAIKGISGVDQIFGTAGDGYAQIITLFLFEKDPQVGTQDIRDAISGIRQDLPVEMKEPVLQRFDPADIPIVSITMNSQTISPAQLTRLADPAIVSKLKGIPGVAQVQLVGGVKREMTIQLKPEALQATGISVGEVVGALQAQNLAAPVGRVNGNLDERTIRLQGRLEGPQDFNNLVVAERNGQIVRLGEVADAIDGTEEQRSLALYNGVEAVGINIVKSKGYSTTAVSDKIRKQVEDIQKTLPVGVKMDIVRDAGKRVADSVRNVIEALIIGAGLTILVVFLFLNSWRSTVITGLALPVSVMASFIAVWAFGFTLNTMSLLGLSLAIGILIDDAIVVRENIVRHIEMGKDHMTASHEGTDEIGLAVAATTFSIVAVFVPIAFMYGVAGQWFKPIALTIASSVLGF